MKKNKYIWIVAVLVLVLALSVVYYKMLRPSFYPASEDVKEINVLIDPNNPYKDIEVDGYTIKAIPPDTQVEVAMPDLDRVVQFGDISQDVKLAVIDKLNDVKSALKENPDDFQSWLMWGVYLKMAEDYGGAEEAWEYAGYIRPNSYIPSANLGDLYGFYLKDPQKAEIAFLKALELDSTQIFIYRNLYDFYRYIVKDDAKTRAILERGITSNPNSSQDLQYLLNNF